MFVNNLARFVFLTLAINGSAHAVVATNTPWSLGAADVGAVARIGFNGVIDQTEANGLGAEMVLRFAGVSQDTRAWDFEIVRLSNVSGPAPIASRVSTFGFNVFDDTSARFTGASASGSYAFVSLNANPPQLDGRFSVCFRSSSSGNCNGGAGGGVWAGEQGSGRFTLNFSGAVGNVALNNFFVRYQSIDNVPGFANGNSGVGVVEWLEPIPEPQTWMMLIAGFGLVGAAMRRRYSTQSSPLSR